MHNAEHCLETHHYIVEHDCDVGHESLNISEWPYAKAKKNPSVQFPTISNVLLVAEICDSLCVCTRHVRDRIHATLHEAVCVIDCKVVEHHALALACCRYP